MQFKFEVSQPDYSKITNPEALKQAVLDGNNSIAHRIEGRKVLRPSSIDTHCPYQWAMQTFGFYESKPKPANTIGTAYHAAAEAFDTYRILTNGQEQPPVNFLKEVAEQKVRMQESYYTQKFGGDLWKDNEDGYSKYDSRERLFSDLEYAVEKIPEFIGSEPVPLAAETRFTAYIDHPIFAAVSGSVDRLTPTPDGGVVIDDYKFVKSYTQEKLKTYAVQQSIYGWLAKGAGLEVKGNRLLAVDRQATKKKFTVKKAAGQIYDKKEVVPRFLKETLQPNYKRAWSKIVYLLNSTKLVDYYVKNGVPLKEAIGIVFPTTGTGDFLCDKKWCDVWDVCPINTGNIPML